MIRSNPQASRSDSAAVGSSMMITGTCSDKRAGNLNDLLLCRGQLSGHSRGIDCSADSETIEDRSGPPFGFTSRIEHSAQAGLAAEENVLGNAEVGNDHQFLEDSDDPVAPGVGRRRKGNVGAVDRNRSGVGPRITAQNADQRRLARAVLPNQRVDFAPAQNQRNIGQRPHRRIFLGDACHRDDRYLRAVRSMHHGIHPGSATLLQRAIEPPLKKRGYPRYPAAQAAPSTHSAPQLSKEREKFPFRPTLSARS